MRGSITDNRPSPGALRVRRYEPFGQRCAGQRTELPAGQPRSFPYQSIDDKTRALFETQVQTFSDQSSMPVEIQRFFVMREVNDHFHIGIGRFHTPLGYWNSYYHHGILLQDTVTRPFFLGFEGNNVNALWPIHLIGVVAEGEIAGPFSYEAAIANSNRIDSSRDSSRSCRSPTVPTQAARNRCSRV